MQERREIPIRDLPQELTLEVHEKIRLHSVTMVLPTTEATDALCCSGTLIQINDMPGILTARHVWKKMIKRPPSVGLLVGGEEPYWIKPDVLRAFGPGDKGVLPDVGATIPDLAFVRIPPFARGPIEAAKKVFYSLDVRRQDPEMDLFGERGFWILAGSPQALFDPTTSRAASFLYDTTVDRRVEIGDWDYLFVNLNLPQNPSLPGAYGGLSGGGVWRAAFYVAEDETVFLVEKPKRDIVLSGVAFHQTDAVGRQIIGHGPKSLYMALYDCLSNEIT
jgi:hypothetical protein